MKIVINSGPGGFSLSQKAYQWLIDNGMPLSEYPNEFCWGERGLIKAYSGEYYDTYFWLSSNRTEPLLVSVVETLGEEASSDKYSNLKVIEIPDGTEFIVQANEHGIEHVAEKHRIWE